LSLGYYKANPKTSNPGPKLALVAGDFTVTWFNGKVFITGFEEYSVSIIKIVSFLLAN
jgi:hypothetical protein